LVAIKIEEKTLTTNLLKNEATIYHYLRLCTIKTPSLSTLKNDLFIPNVKWFGHDANNYYMVIDLLGKSLQNVKNEYQTLPLKIVLQIGVKIVNILKTIHDKGLIHRDIKPDNFLFGLNDKRNHLYIIDFGFCKSYLINNKHVPEKKVHNLIGSKMYASINAHNLIELSRRDDLESLGYMLIYFYLGHLSWQHVTQNEDIKELKIKIFNLHLNKLPNVLMDYIKCVVKLDFDEKPNYDFIIDNFNKFIESC